MKYFALYWLDIFDIMGIKAALNFKIVIFYLWKDKKVQVSFLGTQVNGANNDGRLWHLIELIANYLFHLEHFLLNKKQI